MEKENKVVYVDFSDGRYEKPVHGIEQWDIKPYLAITGLDLEEGVQVHFSLTEYVGDAKRVLGENQNGILMVEIPAFILEGENECCYPYDVIHLLINIMPISCMTQSLSVSVPDTRKIRRKCTFSR